MRTKLIYRKRGRGKTLKLIQECFYANRRDGGNFTYILTSSKENAHRVFEMARKKGYDIPFPISVWEVKNKSLSGTFIRHLLIDDIEEVLAILFAERRIDIPLITMSKYDGSELEPRYIQNKGEENYDEIQL